MTQSPETLRFAVPFVGDLRSIRPRYNIAPTQNAAVIVSGGALQSMRWGLVPSWAQDIAVGNRMINARSETAPVKPAFKRLLRTRRCLVVADGFYEWKKLGRSKQPYYFQFKDHGVFAFAGLWDEWRAGPDSEPLRTFTILTTDANAVVSSVHDRMPVVLPPASCMGWLDPADQSPEALAPYLKPLAPELMEAFPVRAMVGNPANDKPECIERIAGPTFERRPDPELFD